MVKVSIDCEEGGGSSNEWNLSLDTLSELSDKTQKKAEEIINEKKNYAQKMK